MAPSRPLRTGSGPALAVADRLEPAGADPARAALVLERLPREDERVTRTTVDGLAATVAECSTRSIPAVRAADPTPVTGSGSTEGV